MRLRVVGVFLVIGVFICIFLYVVNLNLRLRIIDIELENIKCAIENNVSIINNLQESIKIKDVKKITVTAYSPRKIETDSTPYVTASMERVSHGSVAVSRDLFAEGWVFGSRVYIEGYGIYRINDLMNGRFTNAIDIFFWDTKKAKYFGRKELTVALIRD